MPPRIADATARLSASLLPPDMDPAEKEFVGLLQKALAPSFALVRRLGAGGMGAVYLARDPVLKRLVAVKLLSPTLSRDDDARARFQREAQAVAAISHPNVVAVYSVGELENGVPYLVMQYVEGRPMSERVAADGPLDMPTAKAVLGEVAAALAAAHHKGIIHRDIKPANILWDDASGRALVTDFGIAAVLERGDERDATKITHTGMSIGTPAYMSPEQLLAEPVTEKTDIYGLGLLGYELLVGEGPYAISSPREMMAAHLRDTPRRLSALRTDADPELDQLLQACLAKDPKLRPTAAEVADRLTHGASILLEWPPPGLEQLATGYSDGIRTLTLGGLLLGVPLLAMSAFDSDSLIRQSLPPMALVLAASSLGLLAFLAGIARIARAFVAARRAVAAGYGWLTVAEAASDVRGDTGALITGAREYATLSPAERNVLRTRRLAAGALRVLGAIAPIVGYFVGIVPAARFGGGPPVLLWSSILLGLTLLLVARGVGWIEGWHLRSGRRRMLTARTSQVEIARLADVWTSAFQAVRGGQRLGAGGTGGRLMAPVIAGFMVMMVVGTALLGYTMSTLGTITEQLFTRSVPMFANTLEKVRRLGRLERLRLPPDPSITPLRAGEALYGITRSAGGAERQMSNTDLAEAMRQARRGFTREQRRSIEAAAASPSLAEFRVLGRARSVDYFGAAIPLARLDSLSLLAVPLPKFVQLQRAAIANVAAASLSLADSRTVEAELRLRETLSVGFLLLREGSTVLEHLIGTNIVEKARSGLTALYEQTGRLDDARFTSAASDPVSASVLPDRPLRFDLRQQVARARQMVSDTTLLRGIRFEMLFFQLAYAPCADLHQLVFGVDWANAAAIAAARKHMVRYPSDSVLFAKAERALERPLPRRREGGFSIRSVARIIDWLTGSRRMESCASLLG